MSTPVKPSPPTSKQSRSGNSRKNNQRPIDTIIESRVSNMPENENDKSDDKVNEFRITEGSPSVRENRKQELNLDRHAREHVLCECAMCEHHARKMMNETHSSDSVNFFKNYKFNNPNIEQEKDFVFILKRLIPHKNINRSLRIFIPDTIAFVGGEVKFVVITGKDRTLKYIRQKEKLLLSELRKFFQERKKKKEDFLNFHEIDDKKDEFDEQDTKPEKETSPKGNKVPMQHVPSLAEQINEIVILKHATDSSQILTELEFNTLMQKRKIDPIWRETQFIQAYTKIKKGINNMRRVYFIYDIVKNNKLYPRALNEILYLAGDIPTASEDFIPLVEEEKFEEALRHESEESYCLYILIKIYHFLDVMYGTKIQKMAGEFVRDDQGVIWLIDINKIEYHQVDIEVKDEGGVNKNFESAPKLDARVSHELTDIFKEVEKKESVKIINNLMHQHYEHVKRQVGVDLVESYYEDDLSDNVFKRIHPNVNFKLSDMLKSKMNYSQIKGFVNKTLNKIDIESKATEKEEHIESSPETLKTVKSDLHAKKKDFSLRSSLNYLSSGRTRATFRSGSLSGAEKNPMGNSHSTFPTLTKNSTSRPENFIPVSNFTYSSNPGISRDERLHTEEPLPSIRQDPQLSRRATEESPQSSKTKKKANWGSVKMPEWERNMNPELRTQIKKKLDAVVRVEGYQGPRKNNLAYLLHYNI